MKKVLLSSIFALVAGRGEAAGTIATEGFVRGGLATKADASLLSIVALDVSGKLDKSGGVMTGALTLSADPTANLQAATKQYVDSQVGNILSALNAINGN
jgi:hypothetical protein